MPMDDPGRLGRVLGVPAWRFSGEMGLDVCELRGKFLKSLYSEERVKDIGSIVKSGFLLVFLLVHVCDEIAERMVGIRSGRTCETVDQDP